MERLGGFDFRDAIIVITGWYIGVIAARRAFPSPACGRSPRLRHDSDYLCRAENIEPGGQQCVAQQEDPPCGGSCLGTETLPASVAHQKIILPTNDAGNRGQDSTPGPTVPWGRSQWERQNPAKRLYDGYAIEAANEYSMTRKPRIALAGQPHHVTSYRALFESHIDSETLTAIRDATNNGWALEVCASSRRLKPVSGDEFNRFLAVATAVTENSRRGEERVRVEGYRGVSIYSDPIGPLVHWSEPPLATDYGGGPERVCLTQHSGQLIAVPGTHTLPAPAGAATGDAGFNLL